MKPPKTKPTPGGAFVLKLEEINADPKKNMRFRKSYDAENAEPGQEASSLDGLAESMRKLGQLQNCGVKRSEKGWDLVFGFRRYFAAQKAGIKTLRVIDIEDPTASLAEGTQKKYHAVEIAKEVHRLKTIEKLSDRDIVSCTGLSRQSVGTYLTIMRDIHPNLLAAWERAPGAMTVNALMEKVKLSKPAQLEWLQSMLGLEPIKEEPIGKRKRRERPTVRGLKKAIESGRMPEIDTLSPREAALTVLGILEGGK